MKSIWEKFYFPSDTDNDARITLEKMTSYMRLACADENKRPLIINGLELSFKAIDFNDDKAISPNEFHICLISLWALMNRIHQNFSLDLCLTKKFCKQFQ